MESDQQESPDNTSPGQQLEQTAGQIASLVAKFLREPTHRDYFSLWEEHGFHITPLHFYSPLPDTRQLPSRPWQQESELVGIEMNDEKQLHLLRDVFPHFEAEYSQFPVEPTGDPSEFYLLNGAFSGADPLALFCMVRHFRPQLILEVGGGYSTLVSVSALQRNGRGELICVEPNAPPFLKQGLAELSTLLEKPVQDVGSEVFGRLGPGDILFIDSSHVVRYGSDVNYLYLEVLPRLKPGVLVHAHDIFFPADYPESWLTHHQLFYSEQYLLQAFLTFNSCWEVLLGNNYLTCKYFDQLRATFPTATPYPGGASFWMRRTR